MKEARLQRLQNHEKKERASFPAVTGASSLLVIFSVLCLAVFALLSLSTVLVSHRLEEKNREAVNAYYEAEEKANRIAADLRAGKTPEGVETVIPSGMAGVYWSFDCQISETQTLKVRLWSIHLSNSSAYLLPLRWQAVSESEWEPDPELPLWID